MFESKKCRSFWTEEVKKICGKVEHKTKRLRQSLLGKYLHQDVHCILRLRQRYPFSGSLH